MRIALAGPGYPPTPGGVEQVLAQTARALSRAGHEVEVFVQERRPPHGSPHPDGLAPTEAAAEQDGGVRVHRFPSRGPHDYPLAPGLARALAERSRGFDLVHGHSYHALTGLTAALTAHAPFVFTPHYHGTGHSPLRAALHRVYRPLGAQAFRRAAAVVCVSGAEAGLVAQHFPEAAAKCFVVPNGVDPQPIRAARPYPDEPPTLLSVGRLERYKRVDRLIEAFAELAYQGLDGAGGPGSPGGLAGFGGAQLVIVGAGPDRARLTALASRLAAAGAPGTAAIRFPGRIGDDELHRWLRTARVLCSLSEHEAFGLAPAEALVAGARVVLSDIPAHRELASAAAHRPDASALSAATALPDGTMPSHNSPLSGDTLLSENIVQLARSDEDPLALAARLRRALAAGPPAAPGPAARAVADWDEVARRLIGIYSRVVPEPAGARA